MVERLSNTPVPNQTGGITVQSQYFCQPPGTQYGNNCEFCFDPTSYYAPAWQVGSSTPPQPEPTPTPTPTPDDLENCTCSPIVIDTLGNGFDLTNMQNGVRFDLNGDGVNGRLSWTSANSDDAWLALDNNGNGEIDDGTELFGNFTAQPEPPAGEERNGFRALAVFDRPENGGNNDGLITAADAIFESLRLWQDVNHNGRSERRELQPLAYHGLALIDLDYERSRRTDQYGNQFKYRARIRDVQGVQAGRWAWDVFLVGTNP